MHAVICEHLQQLAQQQAVQVLFACESGSRAWGFPSTDSDYDVRLVYSHPLNWYLSIGSRKDTLTVPIDAQLDISGWEISKTLHLFHHSNPVLFEWLQSPIVYTQPHALITTLREWMPAYASLRKIMFHYLGLVRRMRLETELDETLKLKKYLYMLRSLYAAMWVRDRQEIPPMEFHTLRMVYTNPIFTEVLAEWLPLKQLGDESTRIPRDTRVDACIENEYETCMEYARQLPIFQADAAPLNDLFRHLLLP